MWKALVVAAGAIGVPGAANAAGGITYDCDTAPGHFSELVLPAPPTPFTVSGNVRANSIVKDKKWAPLTRLRIMSAPASPGAAPTAYGGFELTALSGKDVGIAAETVQAVSFDTSGSKADIIPSSLQPTGAVQPFRLTYDGRTVTVEVAGQTQGFLIEANPSVVQVVCSTGEFLFTDLKLEPAG
jgi:hypothetical protein